MPQTQHTEWALPRVLFASLRLASGTHRHQRYFVRHTKDLWRCFVFFYLFLLILTQCNCRGWSFIRYWTQAEQCFISEPEPYCVHILKIMHIHSRIYPQHARTMLAASEKLAPCPQNVAVKAVIGKQKAKNHSEYNYYCRSKYKTHGEGRPLFLAGQTVGKIWVNFG